MNNIHKMPVSGQISAVNKKSNPLSVFDKNMFHKENMPFKKNSRPKFLHMKQKRSLL